MTIDIYKNAHSNSFQFVSSFENKQEKQGGGAIRYESYF